MDKVLNLFIGVPKEGAPSDTQVLAELENKSVWIPAASIAWFEPVKSVMGTLLHLVDGTVMQLMPLHGDPEEFARRVDMALSDTDSADSLDP